MGCLGMFPLLSSAQDILSTSVIPALGIIQTAMWNVKRVEMYWILPSVYLPWLDP